MIPVLVQNNIYGRIFVHGLMQFIKLGPLMVTNIWCALDR